MTQGKEETRAEEVARVRSYLAAQAMRRTPEQLVEALREAHRQFLAALSAIPDADFRTVPEEGEWSVADVLMHVRVIAALDERLIGGVIKQGQQPQGARDIMKDIIQQAPADMSRAQMLADLEASRESLIAEVLQADPDAHLDILWGHSEFGNMNWREWLLFARVHTLDHARQLQAIAATLAQPQAS
jgi:uncharacterized damage-inducible protein DinB